MSIRNPKTYYVYTYRPAFPIGGIRADAVKEADYDLDALPPTLTGLWRVTGATSIAQAIAIALEGHDATRLIG